MSHKNKTKTKKILVTKEQQEALVVNYINKKHNQDECIGFIDGLNAMLDLLEKIDKRHREGLSTEPYQPTTNDE